jgi:zinc/manganese transport system substrate-binding protein
MQRLIRMSALSILVAGVLTGSLDAADKIRVVATITDLKVLTEAVGGDLVEVDALARGNQNPHDLEIRPSLMVKVRRADLLVMNGLELDQWAEVVVQGSNNPKVIPGAPGRVDASQGIPVLEVPTTRVDRSMGDVHPIGNPHYTVDPGMAPIITANILDGLARLAHSRAPRSSETVRSSWRVSSRRWSAGPRRWSRFGAPRSSSTIRTSSTSSRGSGW